MPLRGREWKRLRVAHGVPSLGLSVLLDGQVVLAGVTLPGFAPAAGWRFGFGARSGPNIAMLEERHDVRNFALTLGAPLAPLSLSLELSLNAQQYVAAPESRAMGVPTRHLL